MEVSVVLVACFVPRPSFSIQQGSFAWALACGVGACVGVHGVGVGRAARAAGVAGSFGSHQWVRRDRASCGGRCVAWRDVRHGGTTAREVVTPHQRQCGALAACARARAWLVLQCGRGRSAHPWPCTRAALRCMCAAWAGPTARCRLRLAGVQVAGVCRRVAVGVRAGAGTAAGCACATHTAPRGGRHACAWTCGAHRRSSHSPPTVAPPAAPRRRRPCPRPTPATALHCTHAATGFRALLPFSHHTHIGYHG